MRKIEQCEHEFCIDCIVECLTYNIMSGKSDNLICPSEGCG